MKVAKLLRAVSLPSSRRGLKKSAGLTLLEIIIVIALIGTILGIIITTVTDTADQARVDAAVIAMQRIGQNLQTYRAHNYRFPTTDQGLDALITAPADARRWRGPYTDEQKLRDPWDNRFEYESDGQRFRVISPGPDGILGTEDDVSYPEVQEAD